MANQRGIGFVNLSIITILKNIGMVTVRVYHNSIFDLPLLE